LEPKQFELNINYRSHNGILRIASSVIDLIRRFFPDSIDHLSPERSEVGGPRPIFFKGFQAETFLFDVFSVSEQMANCIEFGAEQVIIVRDDKAKERVGKVGIVMTVFEAKGMEFNDVLLYNFFTDSPARQKVRYYASLLFNHNIITYCILHI
jgi:ATP-dependent exoDNAse (exonuclease V) beta subunit